MLRCKACCRTFVHLGRHLGRNDACRQRYHNADFDDLEDDEVEGDKECVASIMDDHHQRRLDHEVFSDVSELYFLRYLGESLYFFIIAAVMRWVNFVIDRLLPEITEMVGESSATEIILLCRRRFSFFSNLGSEKQLESYAAKHRPTLRYIEHRVGRAKGDVAYGILIVDWFTQLMRHSVEARRHVVEKSEIWKSGILREEEPETIADWWQGTTFRKHSFSARRVDSDIRTVLFAIFVGYDDLELLNPLGQCRGDRKQVCAKSACIAYVPRIASRIHTSHCIASHHLHTSKRASKHTRVNTGVLLWCNRELTRQDAFFPREYVHAADMR